MPEYSFNGFSFRIKYPAVMGILNLTPDSFSDGGKYLILEKAIEQSLNMYDSGAQIIDIGGESTRPGSEPVSEQEELSRILPILEKLPKDVLDFLRYYKDCCGRGWITSWGTHNKRCFRR